MYTPNPEIEKLRKEKEAAEKKIEQYRHKIQRLENRKKYYEDGERSNFIFTIPILISKSHPLPSRSPGISGSVRTDTSM